jgi:hypothetical protein
MKGWQNVARANMTRVAFISCGMGQAVTAAYGFEPGSAS